MYFLIPPSEGKTDATKGSSLNLKKLPFQELNVKREHLLNSLIQVCAKNPTQAAKLLDLGPTQHEMLETNKHLRSAHCAPAIEIYSGVLFDHFDYGHLNARGKKAAEGSVLIASALFGFVSPSSPIPAYRLSGSAVLPEIGSLSGYWKPELNETLESLSDELIIDMRSGTYSKLAPLPRDSHGIEVKVMTEIKGVRKSVTHFNKATKGDLLHACFSSSKKLPKKIAELESYFTSLGFDAALEESKSGKPELIVLTD